MQTDNINSDRNYRLNEDDDRAQHRYYIEIIDKNRDGI